MNKPVLLVIGLLVLIDGASLLLFGKAWRYFLGYQGYLEFGTQRYTSSLLKIIIGLFIAYKYGALEFIKAAFTKSDTIDKS